ncbi:MAG TPA: hypothetical protein DD727_03555 [Clostridiales bacterium]|nr:hypothetical protein [Clostridiales bacterium]
MDNQPLPDRSDDLPAVADATVPAASRKLKPPKPPKPPRRDVRNLPWEEGPSDVERLLLNIWEKMDPKLRIFGIAAAVFLLATGLVLGITRIFGW